MKKVLVLAALVALCSSSALAIVAGTKHDLSSSGGQTIRGTYTEVCVYCHTPHGADAAGTAPLWNRTTVAVVTAYGDPAGTMDATANTAGANSTDAILCLSCHDGSSLSTVALLNAPNSGGALPASNVGAGSTLDTDLSNDHPIGFAYTAALVTADGELNDKATVESTLAGALSYGTGNDMWCSSCHDVHGVAGVPTFLRIDNAGSALCTTCHIK